MKLRYKYPERTVGIFVLIAFLIFSFALITVLIDKRIFEAKVYYTAKFADANGLSANSPVYFKGFQIGRITEFNLDNDNNIRAVFEVFEDYKNLIVENSALYKAVNPVTSASSIEFLQGLGTKRVLPEMSVIPSIAIIEGKRLLESNKVRKSGDLLSSLIYNLERLSENINKDKNYEEGALVRAIVNMADAAEKMNLLLDDAKYLTENFRKDHNPQAGTIFRLMNNLAELSDRAMVAEKNLNLILKRADTLLAVYSKPDSLAIRMLDPTGEMVIKPLRTLLSGTQDLLPELQSLTKFVSDQKGEILYLMKELRITLEEMKYTFETINNSSLMGGGPVKYNQSDSVSVNNKK